MFGQSTEESLRRRAEDALPDALHHRDETESRQHHDQRGDLDEDSATCTPQTDEGAWGERDVGGPVNQRAAMHEFAELQQELTADMARVRSHAAASQRSTKSRKSLLQRVTSHKSREAGCMEDEEAQKKREDSQPGGNLEEPTDASDIDDFSLETFMRDGHLEKRTETGESAKKVGVVFKNLTVKGVPGGSSVVRTLPEAVLGSFGPDLYHVLGRFFPQLRLGRGTRHSELRTLIHDFTGVVRPGEMMLVLGRPGSGCSTFLRAVANNPAGYASVEGSLSYGGIPADEVRRRYRGEVVYNGEDDEHLPSLTVGQTLRFALLNKTRRSLHGQVDTIVDAFLRMFSIRHTEHTLVGNAFVRGVSGGERKRVSIAETLATKSAVVCWDNSTRGLDASTALDYARSLRIMTDVSGRTTITTLYQAGEGIYELMDRVLVIDEGRMLYQGPAAEARKYFEDLGFYAPPRQTTADFLTSLCDPVSRRFREGWEHRCPKTPAELEKAFRESPAYQRLLDDVAAFEDHLTATNHADARQFRQSVREQKSRRVPSQSNYTVPFWKQVLACARRELWLTWGNKTELWSKCFTIISNALIVGSLFYNAPASTDGSFIRGGALFFAVVFIGWLQLAELIKAISGRTVIARHRDYAFYRPSAVALGRALADFPLLITQVVVFVTVLYFMSGLDRRADKFFTQVLFTYSTAICLTAMYRMFAALSSTIDDAVRFTSMALNILAIYAGYVIGRPVLLSQKIWFGWITYVNPLSYSFEAAVSNEFHGRVLDCASSSLIPQGPGVLPENQVCAVPGARPGNTDVLGDDHIAVQFGYFHSHLWRNFGVIVAFTVLYLLVTVVAVEVLSFAGKGPGRLVFVKKPKQVASGATTADEEKGATPGGNDSPAFNGHLSSCDSDSSTPESPAGSDRVFTWEDVSYSTPTPSGPKKLLNGISGYAKPGTMVALMGASGAGKTTLLNTLSQRQTVGVVSGAMLVNGKPLPSDFRRATGFVEQMDLHEESATVREAVEFSALLRQDHAVPRHEKLAYVDNVLDLLELRAVEHALVGSLGVEQRKRLTIAVELAARPSMLLFLDEPTSGLDAQSAMSIVRFLRRLCAAGLAVVCTIHQPSSDLIQQFDLILALNPGGNTVYFGPVGEDGAAVVRYFADRGIQCSPGRNVAEFLLETAIKGARRADGSHIDWSDEWRKSAENRHLIDEVQKLKAQTEQPEAVAATLPSPSSAGSNPQSEFAAPWTTQTLLLTQRMFRRQWRSPSYLYARFWTAVISGVFNGFTFWDLGTTASDLQNRVFSSFLIIMIPAAIMNAVLPRFYLDRALWETREHPSRIYSWVAFATAEVVSEIPGNIIASVLYWLLWYLPTGMPRDPGSAGYVFLMTLLFFVFQSSWAQWICAWTPNFTVISNILPCFMVVFGLFNGVVVPYSQLNVFWKHWLYWLNPASYWVSGVLSATLVDQEVRCAPAETAHFNPPLGQTCAQFAGDFVRNAGHGYLLDPNATSGCGYCPYTDGAEYLQTLGIDPDTKWRNFGIFLMFCVTNWMLVYFFLYMVRVKGFTFGFGPLFRVLNKAGNVKGWFKRERTESEEKHTP
ncbi:hypothetical protein VTJ83DRAFT_1463 [Remersonia thermophila]|uniref:ABC transporter domain-containing protein n=1 Tax=Remersonia thermophila TaxID=72144 RepID=A0ABR4DIC0_9PEZI